MKRRDWAGYDITTDIAYAMVNYKEFFAEMSVTYLSCAYPYLNEYRSEQLDECSPPLLAPKVLARVEWKSKECFITSTESKTTTYFFKRPWFHLFSKHSSVQSISQAHCNKFYPFTKGQLKYFDPHLHDTMEKLWTDINLWIDDDDDSPCRVSRIICLPCWQ